MASVNNIHAAKCMQSMHAPRKAHTEHELVMTVGEKPLFRKPFLPPTSQGIPRYHGSLPRATHAAMAVAAHPARCCYVIKSPIPQEKLLLWVVGALAA